MKNRIFLIIVVLIINLFLYSCENIEYSVSNEFKLKIFNGNISIIGFNDDYYNENLVINEEVRYYDKKDKEYKTGFVLRVEENAFRKMNLKSITFNVTEKSKFTQILDYAFADNKDLTTIILPKTIIEIGDYAFSNDSSLETINLYEIQDLGNFVFMNCEKLEEIDLGNNINTIGNNTFENCNDNLIIKISNPIPPTIGDDIFKNVNSFKIIVPSNLLETYKNADGWAEYSSSILPSN